MLTSQQFLEHCTLLTNLDLQHNLLTEIPEAINFCTNLTHLDLSNNKLTKLPTLRNLQALVVFNANNNLLNDFPELPSESKLASVDLSFNRLQNLPEGFGPGTLISFLSRYCNFLQYKLYLLH